MRWFLLVNLRALICGLIGAAVVDGFPEAATVAVLLNFAFLVSDWVQS